MHTVLAYTTKIHTVPGMELKIYVLVIWNIQITIRIIVDIKMKLDYHLDGRKRIIQSVLKSQPRVGNTLIYSIRNHHYIHTI